MVPSEEVGCHDALAAPDHTAVEEGHAHSYLPRVLRRGPTTTLLHPRLHTLMPLNVLVVEFNGHTVNVCVCVGGGLCVCVCVCVTFSVSNSKI